MRRKYFGLAMAAAATLGPAQAFGGDREIAQSIIDRLQVSRDAGELKGFSLDMKVDEGVVLFRGKISGDQQRAIVLATSEGIDGIRNVVDELEVTPAKVATSKPAKIYKPGSARVAPQATAELATMDFNFSGALASPADQLSESSTSLSGQALADRSAPPVAAAPLARVAPHAQEVVPGVVLPTAAYEGGEFGQSVESSIVEAPVAGGAPTARPERSQSEDQQLAQSVVRAISRAQAEGYLKNFGVDVQSYDGVIEIEGNAASQQQSEFLEKIAQHAPGARGVRNRIKISPAGGNTPARPVAHRAGPPAMAAGMAQPNSALQPLPAANRLASTAMQPVRQAAPMPMQQHMPQQMPQYMPQQMPPHMQPGGVPAQMAGHPQAHGGQQIINGERVIPGSMVNHGAGGGSYAGQVGGGGAPMMGQPVPMAPAAPAGAPRYDSPNLPNYAWPGYAAHPNYAALSYPQQYSPSAFPFIGPFYPYPQVPLGWRKVSLEWDDGWWFLDFTDK